MSNVINQIKTLLGMEVKLEQMKLENGTVLEADAFEAGNAVFIVNEEDRVALPIGEYKLEDGKILIVEVEGEIKEVKEEAAEEVVEEAPVVEEEQEMEATTAPKKVVESVTKETFFSAIEELKKEIESLKSVKAEVKEELSAEPLVHNPEAKLKTNINLFGQNRPKTTFDSVLSKITNK